MHYYYLVILVFLIETRK